MTPEDFAADHGLSVEEARLILERRSLPKPLPGGRLAQAMEALAKALGKTGVAPVRVNAEGVLEKSEFPGTDNPFKPQQELNAAVYAKVRQTIFPAEDISQDPEDWK